MKTTSCFLLAILASCLVGSTLFASQKQEPKKGAETKPDGDIFRYQGPPRRGCDVRNPLRADLSGDYIGTIKVPQLSDAIWKAKLHIDKDEFTLFTDTGEGDVKVTGTLSAVKTCDYTSAAFRILGAEGGRQNVDLIEGRTFSLKATLGRGLALTDVAGQSVDLSFFCDCNTCKNPKKCDCCGG